MINPNSDRARYLQIADFWRARIDSGEFGPGARLPSEEYLSGEFGVARVTAHKAFDVLRAEGRIETRGSKGTFVRKRPPEELVDLARGSVVRARMPTPEERRRCGISDSNGVPVLVVERAGESVLYAGDRTVLRVR